MTDEEVAKGREWLARLESLKPVPKPPPTLESAIRRVPGSARPRIEAERKLAPAPMVKLNEDDVNAAVRAAESGTNERVSSTVVRWCDYFLPYPFASVGDLSPDLVRFRTAAASHALIKSIPVSTAPVSTGGGSTGG